MKTLPIKLDLSLVVSSGAFGARVSPDTLFLPEIFRSVIEEVRIRNASEFLAALEQWPSMFLKLLEWELPELKRADESLRSLIATLHPDLAGLHHADPDSLKRQYGAKPTSR
jgi:hypothetical protein